MVTIFSTPQSTKLINSYQLIIFHNILQINQSTHWLAQFSSWNALQVPILTLSFFFISKFTASTTCIILTTSLFQELRSNRRTNPPVCLYFLSCLTSPQLWFLCLFPPSENTFLLTEQSRENKEQQLNRLWSYLYQFHVLARPPVVDPGKLLSLCTGSVKQSISHIWRVYNKSYLTGLTPMSSPF